MVSWNDDASVSASAADCHPASGAESYFAYTTGQAACGSAAWCTLTGSNSPNKDVLIFVEDSAGNIDMALLHDSQDSANADGGKIQMSIDSTLVGVGTNVKIFDDRGARNASDGVQWYVCWPDSITSTVRSSSVVFNATS